MDLSEAARPSWIEIDLEALAHNYRTLRAQIGNEPHVIAAVKGNAYGHGAGPVARCLAHFDVHSLATGSFDDALTIREAGVDLPILMFGGALPEGMPLLLEHGLTPTVYDVAAAEAVSRAAKRPTAVYVKVDAGLGRLGVPLYDALDFIAHIGKLENLVVEGVYTHLPFHDPVSQEWASARLAAFDSVLDALEAAGIEIPITQVLASSGLLAGLKSRANAVCPGHLLYGLSPVSSEVAELGPYRPVLKAIKSRIIHTASRSAGGRAVGVVPLGLADGYRSPEPDARAFALLAGRRAPILGVSLEYTSLDLSDFDDARVGDEVVMLGKSGGEEITLGDIAAWQGSKPYAVLMDFDRRLTPRYLGDPEGAATPPIP